MSAVTNASGSGARLDNETAAREVDTALAPWPPDA